MITELTDYPVLQDTDDEDVAEQYGAAKWNIYVIRADGTLHILHYDLKMPTQLDRLTQWIEDARSASP